MMPVLESAVVFVMRNWTQPVAGDYFLQLQFLAPPGDPLTSDRTGLFNAVRAPVKISATGDVIMFDYSVFDMMGESD
jgi:hypothetical protein